MKNKMTALLITIFSGYVYCTYAFKIKVQTITQISKEYSFITIF